MGSVVVSLAMVVIVNLVRVRNTKKPIRTGKHIMLPPMFMASGALMYLIPIFRPTLNEVWFAIIAGMLCSILLIKTSNFELIDGEIYLQRSRLFLVVLIALVAARMIGKILIADVLHVDAGQMSGMFFLLAFSMILPWRIGMLMKYLQMKTKLAGLSGNRTQQRR